MRNDKDARFHVRAINRKFLRFSVHLSEGDKIKVNSIPWRNNRSIDRFFSRSQIWSAQGGNVKATRATPLSSFLSGDVRRVNVCFALLDRVLLRTDLSHPIFHFFRIRGCFFSYSWI